MDYKSIRELIEAVSKSELSHLEVESDGLRIVMKKEVQQAVVTTVLDNVYSNRPREIVEQPVTVTNNVEEVQKNAAAEKAPQAVEKEAENYKVVKSPIVGTFYGSASPDSPVFVKVGSKVKKGDVLCIVEAMKLMNEIESEFDGEIAEILVANEQLVEYNQPLFKIKA